jgi:hypothetical protein
VTWCEPRFVEPTSVYLPAGIVAARLKDFEAQPPLDYARLHRLIIAWRR